MPRKPRILTVDGQRFTVTKRGSGVYDFEWVSGPNPGYGFTTSVHGANRLTEAELEESARDFLSQIDPETGYID
ncbi:hypothetical protein HUT18_04875 [Streptomyces sp. NA04227]|uniref:hypothetical protein n=1 Tax=Streptomyces sp. NA04227 TaxID=2742136 RepID=UPI0015925C69|nr:hypothetical protein [Streptomyces sp. NA04227]QKW05813.1 hypothetical protein HUT18_04875 [Streptomyces sp. NA04227]